MRKGRVYAFDVFAGWIEEKDDEYVFAYGPEYLKDPSSKPVSLTLPLQDEPFRSKTMLPFFDGLIPEGWLLDIAVQNWKLDPRDRMGLLLTVCKDCIGAVHVVDASEEK